MVTTYVEFQEFTAGEKRREYHFRVRRGADSHQFTVSIPNEAFLSGRARYQDAPDLCYMKLQREIEACDGDALPAASLTLTDQELEEYRVAHTPKTPGRRF